MKTLTLLGLLPLLASWPTQSQAQYRLKDDTVFPVAKRYFNIVGDDQPVRDADLDIQAPTDRPALRPALPHPTEVAQSDQEYNAGHYAEAAAVLATAAAAQPADPQVLNAYARALYRDQETRASSAPVYRRLVQLLDVYGRENDTTTVVYLPFAEAYYKLATLQMDENQWAAAAYNLSRTLMALRAVPSLQSPAMYEQLYQYQTECFAELGNAKLSRYYGQRTLKLFPRNQYVRPYLARLPAEKPRGSKSRRP